MNAASTPTSKFQAARKSLTVWFSAAVPVLLSVALSLQEQLPVIGTLLSGWNLVIFSAAIGGIVTYLRVRQVGRPAVQEGEAGDV